MCELAGEWLKSRKLRQFSDRHTLWEQADQFSRLVHDSLDMREVAYTVANEGRRLIGSDRVSVAINRGSTCHIEAISGQDTLENRSNIVHLLSQLSSRVVATGEPLWYDGVTDDLPPQVESALEDYVDESYTQSMVVLPLRKPKQFYEVNEQETARSEAEVEDNTSREIFGALIVEQIESNVARDLLEPRVDLVYEHSARALANSLEQHNLFLMPLWKTLGRSRWLIAAKTLPKTLAVAIGVIALLIVMIVVPIPFNMEANGTLQPVAKKEVFAQLNGIVSSVHKDHGDPVVAGDILLELRNPDLYVESEQLNGQINSARERISSIDKTLIEGGERLSEDQRVQLSGERAQLQAQLASLDIQRDLVDDKIEMLKVRAPISGQVISWNVAKNLENRPVQPGMVLMTIADRSLEWELEVHMRESRTGHLLRFMEDHEGDMTASYILNAAPGDSQDAILRDVRLSTDLHQDEGHTVKILLDIKKEDIPVADPRPGAEVTVDIHCGWAPIGYCWFHEAWEWAQKNIMF
jgi:hypothetical protein